MSNLHWIYQLEKRIQGKYTDILLQIIFIINSDLCHIFRFLTLKPEINAIYNFQKLQTQHINVYAFFSVKTIEKKRVITFDKKAK